MLLAVDFVGIFALRTWPEDLDLARLANTHLAAVHGVVSDRWQHAAFPGGMRDQFVADVAILPAADARREIEAQRGAIDLRALEVTAQGTRDEQGASRQMFFHHHVVIVGGVGRIVEGERGAETLPELERFHRRGAHRIQRGLPVADLVVVIAAVFDARMIQDRWIFQISREAGEHRGVADLATAFDLDAQLVFARVELIRWNGEGLGVAQIGGLDLADALVIQEQGNREVVPGALAAIVVLSQRGDRHPERMVGVQLRSLG